MHNDPELMTHERLATALEASIQMVAAMDLPPGCADDAARTHMNHAIAEALRAPLRRGLVTETVLELIASVIDDEVGAPLDRLGGAAYPLQPGSAAALD